MNPFTDESRDARLKLAVPGLCDTLRAPESLHRLVMEYKPAVLSVGDFALKSMLDAVLLAHIVRGDYRAVQRLLGALFGPVVPDGRTQVPNGTEGAERHRRSGMQ
ncbi:MAG TPA: hypothetical protein VNJ53_13935 [Gaiellaceae bacterium]|nr:hypothetical protein [Gaiellaceae bacterium]